jgi:SSS family solute:Na+ symporter
MPQFELHAADLLVIALYAIAIVGYGIYVARREDDTEDYFLAGRSLTWWLVGFSLFASNVSSSTLLGLSSAAYSSGIAVYNYEWMAVVVLIVFIVFFLPFYLKSGVFTMPEFLERRFDGRSRMIFAGLLLFMNIIIDTAAGLYAGALVIQILYPGFPMLASVAILGVLAGFYTITGGLKAVVYTDAVQAVLLLVGAAIVAFESYIHLGGTWADVVAQVPEQDLSVILPASDPVMPWPGIFTGVFLLGFYFWATNQFMVQRTLGAKNLNEGRWGALFAGFLKLPILFIMILPGIFGRLIYPAVEFPELAANSDLIYPTLMFDFLPIGVRGLIVAALLAAIMSSVDSTLNSASTIVTMDIWRKIRPDATQKTLVTVGRVVTFGFMLFAILWAPLIASFPNIWVYLQSVLAYLSPPIVACFVAGVFWPRANRHGAFWAILGGLAISAGIFAMNATGAIIVQTGILTPEQVASGAPVIHFLYLPGILLVASLAILAAVSLATPPPDADKVRELTWTTAFFKAEEAELATLPWYKNYRIQAAALATLTALILFMFW